VEFEWDEAKRLSNIAKHDIDFFRARALFDGRPLLDFSSDRSGEQRFASTGIMEDQYYTVVWTWRGAIRRIISVRRARDGEKRAYRSIHG